jgi:hypothetical protein
MPIIRCSTIVWTSCSTSSAIRASVKHDANLSLSRIARSVSPSSRAPASDVIVPPSNAAITWRPAIGANSNSVGLHSGQHRGTPLLRQKPLLQKNFRRFRAPVHLFSVRYAGFCG